MRRRSGAMSRYFFIAQTRRDSPAKWSSGWSLGMMAPSSRETTLLLKDASSVRKEKEQEMSFTTGATFPSGWRRIKGGYVALAAAAALAVTAAVGMAFTLDGGSGPSSSSSTVQPAPRARVQPAQTFIYVVGSQEEAIALEMAFNEALALGTTSDFYDVLVVDTPVGEASFQLSQRELADTGLPGTPSGVTLVDTR
jgi:hypothetical protein